MEINKDKKQKEIERVFLGPNMRPFLALTIKEDTDVEDEFEEVSEDNKSVKKVQQTIKGRVFTTEIVFEQEIDKDSSVREEIKSVYVLPLGTRLIWVEGQGYIAPKENFQTLDEIKEVFKLLEE